MAAISPLGKAIERTYGGSRVGLDALMAEIQAQAGSGRKAAKLVGVGETTWRRWRSGNTTPKPANLTKVTSAVRGVRAASRPLSAGGLRLKTRDRHDGRERTIRGGQLGLSDSDIMRIEEAYIADGPDAAAEAFVDAIDDEFYHDYFDGEQHEEAEAGEYGGTVSTISW